MCGKELQRVLPSGKEGYGIRWDGLTVSVMLFLKKPEKVWTKYCKVMLLMGVLFPYCLGFFPTWAYYSQKKWCENLIRQDTKVLVCDREGSLLLITCGHSRSKVLFYCSGVAQCQSSTAVGWVSSFSATQPSRTSSLQICSATLISEITLWVKMNHLWGWDGIGHHLHNKQQQQ